MHKNRPGSEPTQISSERVRAAYWQALDEATNERDGKQRLQDLVDQLDGAGYTAAAECLADDLEALVVHLRYPIGTVAGGDPQTCSSDPSARSSAAPR